MEEKKPRGGQQGNQNAKRANHTRLVVSYSGDLLNEIYEAMARENKTEPSEKQVKDFIRRMTRMGLEK